MNKTIYAAYGSNMNINQMKNRCPGAVVLGVSELQDYELVFRYHATVEPRKGAKVPLLLWELNNAHVRALDRYEGVAGGYYRKEYMKIGEYDDVLIYIMNGEGKPTAPDQYYFFTIAEGFISNNIDTKPLIDARKRALCKS